MPRLAPSLSHRAIAGAASSVLQLRACHRRLTSWQCPDWGDGDQGTRRHHDCHGRYCFCDIITESEAAAAAAAALLPSSGVVS